MMAQELDKLIDRIANRQQAAHWLYFRRFLKNPVGVASLTPSSPRSMTMEYESRPVVVLRSRAMPRSREAANARLHFVRAARRSRPLRQTMTKAKLASHRRTAFETMVLKKG